MLLLALILLIEALDLVGIGAWEEFEMLVSGASSKSSELVLPATLTVLPF